jgi:dihydrolipoamide dehydrogenase
MYDLIVIGGGPAGYTAAERAGALGKSVLVVEKENLGGVCLNVGCIPTKTLLHASKLFHAANTGARFGVNADALSFDLSAAMKHKTKTVDTLVKGVAAKLKRARADVIEGSARLIDRKTVEVEGTRYEGRNVLIATGSSSAVPPIPGIDSEAVVTSTELLSLDELPGSLVVIGGGYIGMEFAGFFSTLGVPVTVIEMMDEVIPFMEEDLAKTLRRSIETVQYELGSKVTRIEGNTVYYERDGEQKSIDGEVILVSVGRNPNVDDMGFEDVGIDVTQKGVRTDERQQTNLPGVYAAGDVTGTTLLAHAAYRMAEVAVANMFEAEYVAAGGSTYVPTMHHETVPWVVFTSPEVAGCGMTEKDAADQGLEATSTQMPMRISGRYLAEHPRERGYCKLVTETATGRILGVHMIGSGCSELIFGAAMAIELELRAKDLRNIVFPHPTLSEVLRESAWEV